MIDKLYKIYLECNRRISTDTRNILPGSIFFALKGESFDGNEFATEAIQKGASYCVVDNSKFANDKTIQVENVLHTLQNLATYCRLKESYHVLALTGSNGKTTTKELIRDVLSTQYNCAATKGNLNNHIGVPITILNTPPETEILVVEMGANHIGEIEFLCQIALPDSGLITNIGKAHLEGFGNIEGVMKAKSELYRFLTDNNKPIFLNSADKILTRLAGKYHNKLIYGSVESNCYASSVKFNEKINVEITLEEQKLKLSTNLFGKFNVTNILAALKVANYFSVDMLKAVNAIEKYKPQNNRSQIKHTENNRLILDSYNANPTSMKAAIESFLEIESKNKVVILGEMKELGMYAQEEHKWLFNLLMSNKSVISFFIGESFMIFKKEYNYIFKNTQEFRVYLKKNKLSDSLILLKGSRANKLETVIEFL